MSKSLILVLLVLLNAIICRADDKKVNLLPGDLLFQVEESSDFAKAIVNATGKGESNYCHVGIYVEVADKACVIEATPRKGVTITPLDEFLEESDAVEVIRISLPEVPGALGTQGATCERSLGERAAAKALTLIGRPYDWRFAEGDSAVYCSELVQIAYREAAGREVFESEPMNFLDADGRLSDFWVKVFEREGCAVPQGKPGTNPNSMARAARKMGTSRKMARNDE